jgi:quinoprotein glucose dehydrogenase
MLKRLAVIFPVCVSFLLIILATGCSRHREGISAYAGRDWPVYLGDDYSNHYSSLTQINKNNINHLEVAWEYHTGDDVSDNRTQIQCNPIILHGVLYGTSPKLKVFALDAFTGKRIWEFDPDPENQYAKNVNRGVSFWHDGSDRRILFASGPELFAINADNGEPVRSFGREGKVSLNTGLGDRAKDLYVVATTPGVVYRDLLIIGSRVSEEADAAPGYIRAFNIRTGNLEWVFNTIPKPGEFGYDTWPEGEWKRAGGANSWAGMSLDRENGIIYVPTGSASFDFWGGNRKGSNLFSNCILALNASTGKRIWHYQTVHHDLWDRDLPAPPNLVTITRNGQRTDAVAQITKSGFVFLFNRKTGDPVFPIEERPAPGSDLKGESTWPSQPVPLAPPPFVPQVFTENEVTRISPESHEYVSQILAGIRKGNLFMPPSEQGTLIFPGFDGGGEWGGAAVDPNSAILYINSSIMPWILTMVEVRPASSTVTGEGELTYRVNCAACHGLERQGIAAANYPALISVADKYTKKGILDLINTGRGFMPSFRHLSEQKKQELVAFLTGQKVNPAALSAQPGEQDQDAVPYTHTGYNRFLDQRGFPAINPPWGIISAIDLNRCSILWQVPLGEYPELTARGIPKTGTENYGGAAITAGGILFIGASRDEYFRAFDKDTGKELWKFKLPAGAYATPSIYEAKGKQFVVIACGGGKMGTKSGDGYVAFTLKTGGNHNE